MKPKLAGRNVARAASFSECWRPSARCYFQSSRQTRKQRQSAEALLTLNVALEQPSANENELSQSGRTCGG